ncbi:hypothetical protein C8R43DRAFT_1142319 [Mycena crocata]|nr:hypothetical protein C8R43DRAFT_1142319 [Mycena crocata]
MTSFAVSSGTASVPGATPSSDTIVAALQLLNAAVRLAHCGLHLLFPPLLLQRRSPMLCKCSRPRLMRSPKVPPRRQTAPAPPPVHREGSSHMGPGLSAPSMSSSPPDRSCPIGHEPDGDEEALWYCITKGHVVGVHLSHALALASVTGVSNSAMKAYKTQALAVAAFNELLQYRLVAVLP